MSRQIMPCDEPKMIYDDRHQLIGYLENDVHLFGIAQDGFAQPVADTGRMSDIEPKLSKWRATMEMGR